MRRRWRWRRRPGTATPGAKRADLCEPQSFTVGSAIAPLTATVVGTVAQYSVAPALPGGLVIDTTSGQITGTPTAGDHGELCRDCQQQRRLGDVRTVPLSAASIFAGAAILDDDWHRPGHPGFCDTQEQHGESVSQLSGCGPDHLVFRATGNCVGGCQWCHHGDQCRKHHRDGAVPGAQRAAGSADSRRARRAGCERDRPGNPLVLYLCSHSGWRKRRARGHSLPARWWRQRHDPGVDQ